MNTSHTQATQKLPSEIYGIEKELEASRLVAINKSKGRFKRAFFRSWIVLATVFVVLGVLLSEQGGFRMVNMIGPVVFTLFLSLVVAGIYAFVRKGSSNYKFAALSKELLIPKIITFVNPDLAFSAKGISKKEFDAADLFDGPYLISEDTIEGTIEGAKVISSECMSKSETRVYFNGPFIQIEMKHIHVSTPLKFFPSIIAENFREEIKNFKGSKRWRPLRRIRNDEEDRVVADPAEKAPNYEIYCKSEQEARVLLTPHLLKFVAFFYAKYGKENVFISLNQNKCYLALAQDEKKNLFDTDTYLKKNLVESHFADQVHQDAQLVNQLMKEITLINTL